MSAHSEKYIQQYPSSFRSLQLDNQTQQNSDFSDEEELNNFKLKAHILVYNSFGTPSRRRSKSIMHLSGQTTQKQVKFSDVKLEKLGDDIYVSELQNNQSQESPLHYDTSTSEFSTNPYPYPNPSPYPQNGYSKRNTKKLLIQNASSTSKTPLTLPKRTSDHPEIQSPSAKETSRTNASLNFLSMPSSPKAFQSPKILSTRQSLNNTIDLNQLVRQLKNKKSFNTQDKKESMWKKAINNILVEEDNMIFQHHLQDMLEHNKIRWTKRFKDSLFPPNQFSISSKSLSLASSAKWVSLEEIVGQNITFTVGKNIDYRDICTHNWMYNYIAQVLSALASKPHRIQKILSENSPDINSKQCYVVRLNCKGTWLYFLLDSMIPIFLKTKEPIFCSVPTLAIKRIQQNSTKNNNTIDIWPYLIEKGLAHYYGSYEQMCDGNVKNLLFDLTGSPIEEYNLDNMNRCEIFKSIDKALNNEWLVLAKVQTTNQQVDRLTPVCRVISIYRVVSEDHCSPSIIIVELSKTRNNAYFTGCTGFNKIYEFLPDKLKEIIDAENDSFSHFLTLEDLQSKFNHLLISKIHDNYFYTSITVKQKSQFFTLFSIEFKNPLKFYLILSQFDVRKMPDSYKYNRVRVILAKCSETGDNQHSNLNYQYRSGFISEQRDAFQEFNCEAGKYLILVLLENHNNYYENSVKECNYHTNNSQNQYQNPSNYTSHVFDSTLSYYGQEKAYFEKIDILDEDIKLKLVGDIFAGQAKSLLAQIHRGQKQRTQQIQEENQFSESKYLTNNHINLSNNYSSINSNASNYHKEEQYQSVQSTELSYQSQPTSRTKRVTTDTLIYSPAQTVNSCSTTVWLNKDIAIIAEIYTNSTLVSLKMSKNLKQMNKKGLRLIGMRSFQEGSIAGIKAAESSGAYLPVNIAIKHFQIPSRGQLTFLYTINDPKITDSLLQNLIFEWKQELWTQQSTLR